MCSVACLVTSPEQQCTTKRAATERIESRKQLHEGGRAPEQSFPMFASTISMANKQDFEYRPAENKQFASEVHAAIHAVNSSISD